MNVESSILWRVVMISWSIFQTLSISFSPGGISNDRLQYELYRANFSISFKNETLRDVDCKEDVVKLEGKELILDIGDLKGGLSTL